MAEKEAFHSVPKSGEVVFNDAACTGCGTCELMCALYHEGAVGPTLARMRLVRDPFNAEFLFDTCRQCLAPSCYFACPLKDEALCICEKTGARYINEDECTSCEECIEACPFDPSEIRLHQEKNVAFKCDLCRGREEGPVCVEFCPMEALTFVPANKR